MIQIMALQVLICYLCTDKNHSILKDGNNENKYSERKKIKRKSCN